MIFKVMGLLMSSRENIWMKTKNEVLKSAKMQQPDSRGGDSKGGRGKARDTEGKVEERSNHNGASRGRKWLIKSNLPRGQVKGKHWLFQDQATSGLDRETAEW